MKGSYENGVNTHWFLVLSCCAQVFFFRHSLDLWTVGSRDWDLKMEFGNVSFQVCRLSRCLQHGLKLSPGTVFVRVSFWGFVTVPLCDRIGLGAQSVRSLNKVTYLRNSLLMYSLKSWYVDRFLYSLDWGHSSHRSETRRSSFAGCLLRVISLFLLARDYYLNCHLRYQLVNLFPEFGVINRLTACDSFQNLAGVMLLYPFLGIVTGLLSRCICMWFSWLLLYLSGSRSLCCFAPLSSL